MIKPLLTSYKRIAILNNLLLSISLGILVSSGLFWLERSQAIFFGIIVTLFTLVVGLRSKKFLMITQENFLEHINRYFPEYQESAQLIVKEKNLTNLQSIQKQKIEKQFEHDLINGRLTELNLAPRFLLPIILIIFSSVIFFQQPILNHWLTELLKTKPATELDNAEKTSLKKQSILPTITNSMILISPPDYTNITTRQVEQLNFKAIQGSRFTGRVNFSRNDLEYFYSRSGKPKILMKKQGSEFIFKDVAEQTSLYQFSYKQNGQMKKIDDIYSVTIIRDQAPKINIIKPRNTLLEFAKSEVPQFTLIANIKDDFGINGVKILASVAKGSGEAVKFRDKQFDFLAVEILSLENSKEGPSGYYNHAQYKKSWRLTDLQMEPGDEAYFSIHAIDNKGLDNQLSKSSSLIIRWLDEDEIEMGLEGIQIKFIPEYFRSQRQIIIETEQLITDAKDIDRSKFEAISTDLGISQNDLKQKYGQYLGDELGESQGAQFGLADGYHGGESMASGEATLGLANPEHSDEDEHSEQKHAEQDEHDGHQHHDTEETTDPSKNLSGAQQLIDQFGHSHSSVEIAPLSQKDPKSWMKLAVNEMWQAELHLMLSEPSKALPFEYKAYKYLKLARQAERVYAKRLGFEPPPVSEKHRLTGELKDILEYNLSEVDRPNNHSDATLFRSSFDLINQKLLSNNLLLSPTNQEVFAQLSKKLIELSENRPTLIKYAAIAEKILVAQSLELSDCINCISNLKAKLWQLIPTPLSRPTRFNNEHILNEKLESYYLKDKAKIKRLP